MANRYFVGGGTGSWNSTTNWSATDGGASGASFPVNGDVVFLTAASGANTLTINVSSACTSIDCTGFTGTLTGSSNLTIRGNFTLVAGMTFSHTGTLLFAAAGTLTSAGKTINNLTFSGAATYVLADDWNVSGTLASTTSTITVNGNNINLSGSSLSIGGIITGTTVLNITSNTTWTHSAGYLGFTTIVTGVLTISGSVIYNTGSFTCLTGSVIADGSTLTVSASSTFNCSNVNWNNITFSTAATQTLTNDLNVYGTATFSVNSTSLNGANLNLKGNGNLVVNGIIGSGSTGQIHFEGSNTWTGTANVGCAVVVDTTGSLTIGTSVAQNTGTFTYIKGKVNAKTTTLTIAASTTYVNIHKINFKAIIVTAGVTLTMNEFFSGSADVKTRISSTTTANYTITFTDNFEKISKFVKVSKATITGRNLLIITDKGNANAGTTNNIGVRYTNTVPNGVPKNNPSVFPTACYGIEDGFVNDPITKF